MRFGPVIDVRDIVGRPTRERDSSVRGRSALARVNRGSKRRGQLLMKLNPQVETWFAEKQPPLEKEMRRVREIILSADPRIEESIKWKTPTFAFKGNIASFMPAKSLVRVMFHRGAEIPGSHPRLEGSGLLVRVVRFANLDEIEDARDDLEAVVRAWCEWKA